MQRRDQTLNGVVVMTWHRDRPRRHHHEPPQTKARGSERTAVGAREAGEHAVQELGGQLHQP